MQTSLALNMDQQDKVFKILYEQIHQQFIEESNGKTAANPAEALRLRQKRQLEALEGVLTPSQLEGYREQQEQKMRFAKRTRKKASSALMPSRSVRAHLKTARTRKIRGFVSKIGGPE